MTATATMSSRRLFISGFSLGLFGRPCHDGERCKRPALLSFPCPAAIRNALQRRCPRAPLAALSGNAENVVQLPRRRLLLLAGAAATALVAPLAAGAESYPARAVRVIVPFAPAGPTDVFSRLMAQGLSEQ